jgi:flagellar biosynthetic protein FliP
VQTASGLSVVLGVFLIVVILGRSWSRCRVMAHGDVVRVLARTSITSKHHLHLVKVHNRLLLLAETPSGLQRLDSIDDPAEISRILEADSTHPVETDEEDLPSRSRTSHMARSTILGWFIAILSLGMLGANAPASETAGSVPDIAASGTLTNPPARSDATPAPWDFHPQSWVQPERIQSSLQIVLMMSVLSLAPAIVLMTTSFVRISIVLALLRQALGTPQVPPPQVTTSVSLFLTLLIMGPVWNQVYSKAIQPYTAPHSTMTAHQAWSAGVQPVREFMANQIELQRNTEDVWLFMRQFASDSEPPTTYEDVPLQALLPAFVLSELKTAFLIGFQVYLPLLVIDVVVATVINAMGLVTLPASMVSLPLKLLLFVLVDGWHLIVGLLLASFHGGTL